MITGPLLIIKKNKKKTIDRPNFLSFFRFKPQYGQTAEIETEEIWSDSSQVKLPSSDGIE